MPGVAIVIVVIVVVVVTLLGSLLKGAEEPQRQGPLLNPNRPPRPMSEVDKFLEEINRLKRQAAGEQAAPPPRPQPPPPPPPRDQRRVEPYTAPAATARSRPPAPESRPRPVRRPRPAEPTAKQRPQTTPVVAELLEVIPVVQPVEVPLVAPVVSKAGQTMESPALAQFRSLLRTPTGIQTAVLLYEVLGSPRCRRHPGR